jgi:hypothetical protein
MSDVNTVKKYARLGGLPTKNLLFKNIHEVIIGYEREVYSKYGQTATKNYSFL